MSNPNAAPSCPSTLPEPIADPNSVNLPSIPVANPNDPNSMAAAINGLRQAYYAERNGTPGDNGASPRGNNPQQSKATKGQQKPQQKPKQKNTSDFVETGRTKQKVRIFNPDDHTQWIDIEQITSLTLVNQVTGETWFWKLGQ